MDGRNHDWTTTFLQERGGGERRNFYPIFFVSLQSAVKKISRHFLVFVQPLNDKRLKPTAERGKTCLLQMQRDSFAKFAVKPLAGELLLTQDILALCS